MDSYALHLAAAALVGASVVAFSAYFMHRKTLSQVLEFARAERERERRARGRERGEDGGLLEEEGPSEGNADSSLLKHHTRRQQHRQSSFRRKVVENYRRGSVSLPDVTVATSMDDGEEDEHEEEQRAVMNGPFSAIGAAAGVGDDYLSSGIPLGLPRLHMLPEGTSESEHNLRITSAGRN